MPASNAPVPEHISAAFHRENVAFVGAEDEVKRIVAAGPRGALVLAALAVATLLAIWLAFFVLIYLPRGPIA
jgi:hypothetical protein